MRGSVFFLLTLLFLALVSSLPASIIHVPADSATIQGGINGASTGDTVLVAPGTYHEHDIDFLGKAIVVKGTDPGDSAVVAATVVDADSLGSVFILHTGEDSASVLQGLKITGGLASDGGGIYCSSSPTISHNIITGNIASSGGGGITFEGSSPTIINNTIAGNSALYGAGISCVYSSSKIASNTITGNKAGSSGGGVYCGESSATIANNNIAGNTAVDGGGVSIVGSPCGLLLNNIIANNTAANNGGGVDCYAYTCPTMANNTIMGNSAQWGGGVTSDYYSSVTIVNSILWGNEALVAGKEIYIGTAIFGSDVEISYSDVEGGRNSVYINGGWIHWDDGMIETDPLFMSYKGYDYLLNAGSPCIDAGDPLVEDRTYDWHPEWPNWLPNGVRSDMGAYGGPDNKNWVFKL